MKRPADGAVFEGRDDGSSDVLEVAMGWEA